MRRCRPAPFLRLTLLSVILFSSLGTALAAPLDSAVDLTNRHNLETRLLHLPIDRMVLGSLPVWDDKTEKLRLRVPGENFDNTTIGVVLILHLWATWCGPCKDEFEIWKELRERMQRQFGYEVTIVHIAMQPDASTMASFVKQQGAKMLPGPKYFDRDERLINLLRPAFPGKELPTLPITLWLGPARTVRQALTGSIKNRVAEVMESTERLLRTIKFQQHNMKKDSPKDEEWDEFAKPGPCACPCICN